MRCGNRKGFTLIELVVAFGLLLAIMAGSGLVFKYAVEAQRAAGATGEIMRKFRAVTDQLNIDFAGIRRDMPLLIYAGDEIKFDDSRGEERTVRVDQIMFFTQGDHSSIGQYDLDKDGKDPVTIRGNVARVQYMICPGDGAKSDEDDCVTDANGKRDKDWAILRRQNILINEPDIDPSYIWPKWGDKGDDLKTSFGSDSNPSKFRNYEYDCLTVEQWKLVAGNASGENDWKDAIIPACCDIANDKWPIVSEPDQKHLLFCDKVGQFGISYADSGVNFSTVSDGRLYNVVNTDGESYDWVASGFPRALKFTFTLYDSKGVFPDGKTFTHIVYLDRQ